MFTGESGRRRGWSFGWAIAVVVVLRAIPAHAIYLDQDQNISFRGRVYSQWAIRAEGSDDTPNYQSVDNPKFQAGQLVQQRNFYNPELDANLTNYTKWMRETSGWGWLAPENFTFRAAAWGFYDGVYDYGSEQYAAAASAPRVVPFGTEKPFVTFFNPSYLPLGQQVIGLTTMPCMKTNGCVVGSLFTRRKDFPSNSETAAFLKNGGTLEEIYTPLPARDVYGHQTRINELYLNYSKGPLFIRLGRQSISWGESDTIALLDANNPFDITLGVPGFFEDLDEARIPLWTIRSSYELFKTLGPFSSGFIEGYLVPGVIDTNFAFAPSPTGQSAYGPTGVDPHLQLAGNLFQQLGNLGPQVPNSIADQTSIVLVDKTLEHRMSNSRGGVRVQSVVGREHTASAWWYKTYNNAPVARLVRVPDLNGAFPAVSSFERASEDVFGLADTFFLEPIDSIIRAEAEYFLNELSFLDWRPAPGTPDPNDPSHQPLPGYLTAPEAVRRMANIPQDGTTNYDRPAPRTNHLRWELGLDRFAFIRFLNPTNSFLLSTAFVGDWNLDATSISRYGYGPGRPTKPFEALFQFTTQTDYMHGKLTPRITALFNYAGVFGMNAKLDYRITDYLIAGLQYVLIDGDFHQLGFFRSYDQVALRLTYQLN